jgi:hypothetical protein
MSSGFSIALAGDNSRECNGDITPITQQEPELFACHSGLIGHATQSVHKNRPSCGYRGRRVLLWFSSLSSGAQAELGSVLSAYLSNEVLHNAP